jgi:cytochrome b561/polyisoprenoid-binding protein YceI
MAAGAQRYTAVAIVLHWATAVAILFMLPLGFWMHEQAEHGDVSEGVFRAFQLHKSIGLTVLALSLVRLGWRLTHPVPPLPPHMPAWEKFAAKATHWAFYALMIGLPLSGWLYVSSGWSVHEDEPLVVATYYFGLFRVPALFGLPQAGEALRAVVAEGALAAHASMAFAAIGLAGLHVVAAVKHHLFDKDAVLAQMVPGLRAPFETEAPPKNPVRLAVLGIGLGLTALALASALYAASTFGRAGAPAPPQTGSSIEIAEVPVEQTEGPAVGEGDDAADVPTAAPAGVSSWRVDPRTSSLGFAFMYDDGEGEPTRFEGRFARWRADIRFDPADLDASSAVVTIETASATDGVQIHDNALPTEPWFDANAHPTAEFRTTSIRRDGDGYLARGELAIKGRTRNVELPFTLSIEADRASMRGRAVIDRRDFDIGERSDAADFISRDVEIIVRLEAVRAP